jgi:predicted thioesterase
MNLDELIQPGMVRQETFRVEEKYLAPHVGSGAVRVLATPWMIAFMEGTSHRLLAERLPEGYSSVGVVVNVRHLAPTPADSRVTVTTQVTGVEKNRVLFKVSVQDDIETVGEGVHERAVIDTQRFLKRVADKQKG